MFWILAIAEFSAGLACGVFLVKCLSRGQTNSDLVERSNQVRDLTRQMEEQGREWLVVYRDAVGDRDDKIKRLESDLATVREQIAESGAESMKLNAENERLRKSLIGVQGQLEQQRGLVANLQESIRINGEQIEDRDDRIDGLNRWLNKLRGEIQSLSKSAIAIDPVTREPRVEDEWQASMLRSCHVSDKPKTCLPKNMRGPDIIDSDCNRMPTKTSMCGSEQKP